MCKKYSNYKINVKFINGENEEIKYNNYKTDSYKEMIELYKLTCDKYKDYCVTIEFIGVTNDGKLNIMWSKDNITKDKVLKEKADLYCIKETEDVLNRAIESLKSIYLHRAYIRGEIESLSKDRSVKLHSIENNKNENRVYSDAEKIAFFDNLKQIGDNRRDYKDNIRMLDILFEKFDKNGIDLRLIESLMKETIEQKEYKQSKIVELTEEKAEELKIVKKVKFRSFNEKISLMMKLQKQFSKVIAKDNECMLYCYKRCYDTHIDYNPKKKKGWK